MNAKPTLRLIDEHKIFELLPGCPVGARLEASGVLFLANEYYLVFDNRKDVALLSGELQRPNSPNALLGIALDEQGYEGITYNPGKRRFYLLIESSRRGNAYYAVVVEARKTDNGMRLVKERPIDFKFESDNKGFEALSYIEHEGDDYLLALCEGNKCQSGPKGRKPGGGRIQVFKKAKKRWEPAPGFKRTIKLPKSVRFRDYSAMAVNVEERRFAILSQEDSKMWVGVFDQRKWEWVDDGESFQFPRTGHDEILYGNVEGIAWMSDNRVAVVSDKRKSNQPNRVENKDQSIHIFDLPGPGE